jgi:D-amino-acid dehydrogenase
LIAHPMARVLVVGAGIVGLSVSRALLAQGDSVTLVDRDPTGDKCSFGNAAGIAVTEVVPASVPGVFRHLPGWLLDPLGPLSVRPRHLLHLLPWLLRFSAACRPSETERLCAALSAINGRVYDDLVPMLAATGLSGELRRCGALTVYETDKGLNGDNAEWALKRAHGIETRILSGDEARELEPALGPRVKHAVSMPQWSMVTDPKKIVDGLRRWCVGQGAGLETAAISHIDQDADGSTVAIAEDGRRFSADKLVVAAGAWSARLAKTLGDRAVLESERGYNVTLPNPGLSLDREIIFSERKFVASPLEGGLRIGGAAEFGGLEAKADLRRSWTLAKLALQYLPGLDLSGGVAWAGHRPATPDSIPVIGASPRAANILYAFGHGHLGLTQAATTARLIADMVGGRASVIDMEPYRISRFS